MISVYYNKTSKIKSPRSRVSENFGDFNFEVFEFCSTRLDLLGFAINFESVRAIAHFAIWIFAHFEVIIDAELS